MTLELQSTRTLSAVAAIFSAFFVFLVGGGVVLKVWVDQRDAAQAPVVVRPETAKSAIEEPKPTKSIEKPVEPTVPAKTTPRPKPRPKPAPPPPPNAGKSAAAPPPPPPTKPRTGKGTVMVMGSASRVRLMGASGTFGPGTVPAGSYTIQATFSGSDPRMAGTVEVNGGERIIVMCSAATQKCVQR